MPLAGLGEFNYQREREIEREGGEIEGGSDRERERAALAIFAQAGLRGERTTYVLTPLLAMLTNLML